MKKTFLISFLFVLLAQLSLPFSLPKTFAFGATLSPGRKVFELERGEVAKHYITLRNNTDSDLPVGIEIGGMFINEFGHQSYVEPDKLEDNNQTVRSWSQYEPVVVLEPKKTQSVPITITVPEDANYGDHLAVVFARKASLNDTDLVEVAARLASVLIVKVVGGEAIPVQGAVNDFRIETRKKARNTANFRYVFNNRGAEFINIGTEIDIFENTDDEFPIKRIERSASAYPNVPLNFNIALGDLGDDYGEKEYIARVTVFENIKNKKGKIFFNTEEKFQYYLPAGKDTPEETRVVEVQKEPIVQQPPLVDIIKELSLYIGGVLVVLLVLVKLLFFSGR